MITQRGTITLELSGGKKVELHFSAWTIMRFCELNGNLSLTELFDLFAKGGLTLKHLVSLLQCGAEAAARRKNEPFSYTEMEVADWLDDLGGIASKGVLDLINSIAAAIDPGTNGKEVKPSGKGNKRNEEKKS